MKDQTYQLAGGKETVGVLKLEAREEHAVMSRVDRVLQLEGVENADKGMEFAVSARWWRLEWAKRSW